MAVDTTPPDVAIVGGGVGGLATAIRLRHHGHRVTLLERHDVLGGKLDTYVRDGHTFDVGPSLLTLPQVFDELFRCAGTRLRDHLDLVRLDPQFAYHWPDGGSLSVHDQPQDTVEAFERFAAGAGEEWRRFDARGRDIWDVALRTFFAGPMTNPIELVRRMRSLGDLTAIDANRTLWDAACSAFGDPRLAQWAGRYATYSGSSPFLAPATLACIPHVETRYGTWYPMGGLGALRNALADLAVGCGVDVRLGAEVVSVRADRRKVEGVELADGSNVRAPIVVANADATHLYDDLLPDAAARRKVARAAPSTSGFVMCAGVTGRTPRLRHHNVWFSSDPRTEFDEIARKGVAADPTVYACVSSRTDPSQAPPGDENWFLLVNTGPGAEFDHAAYGDVVLAKLAANGVDLRPNLRFLHHRGPADFTARFRSPGGAIYGTSSNGRRAAFVRPANRGARRGLYLVGGSSHPGGGLPLVALSARIVADLIDVDGPSDRR